MKKKTGRKKKKKKKKNQKKTKKKKKKEKKEQKRKKRKKKKKKERKGRTRGGGRGGGGREASLIGAYAAGQKTCSRRWQLQSTCFCQTSGPPKRKYLEDDNNVVDRPDANPSISAHRGVHGVIREA